MKNILLVLLFISFKLMANYSGHWGNNSNNSSLSLYLTELDKSIVGRYCFITNNGNRIDCAEDDEVNIKGEITSDNKVEVFFDSTFGGKGKATLHKQGEDLIFIIDDYSPFIKANMSVSKIINFKNVSNITKKIVQGPFVLKNVKNISIVFEKNKDESISLKKETISNKELIDTYEVGDGIPEIETVFFYKIHNENNIVTLVSWDEKNISAVHYKVYVYHYDKNGNIYVNHDVSSDKNLEGYDGYSRVGMIFNYKDALTIKKYLREKYGE
jgi:hypothetical protein